MSARRAAPPDPPRQLAFDLPSAPRYEAEDFLVGPSNEAAYAAIEAWPDWPERALALIGPPGSGKSHLAAIWTALARGWSVRRADLKSEDVARLMAPQALLVEDADQPGDGAALFHLINAGRLRRAHLLFTARVAPEFWPADTPDLASRLRAIATVAIGEPDDALLRAVIVKLFVDRQLVVDTGVVEEIMRRGERSFAGARRFVEALDAAALADRRRITRALARDIAESLGDDRAGDDRAGDAEPV